MKQSVKLGCAIIVGFVFGAICALVWGWQFLAQDACLDGGGVWRYAGSFCTGIEVAD